MRSQAAAEELGSAAVALRRSCSTASPSSFLIVAATALSQFPSFTSGFWGPQGLWPPQAQHRHPGSRTSDRAASLAVPGAGAGNPRH